MTEKDYLEIARSMQGDEFAFENIIARMRSNLKNPASKQEGSFAMDSIQAIAQEISRMMYMRVISYLDLTFLDTAVGEFLDRKADDYGMKRNPATPSKGIVIFTGKEGTTIPKGLGVISDGFTFLTDYEAVISSTLSVSIPVTCITTGIETNISAGAITGIRAVDAIDGVKAENQTDFEGGTEIEDDESFRKRIYEKLRNPISSGNANSYVYWAKQVSGVGNARCIPLWNGNGTVKVVILSSDGGTPDDIIIKNVADYIETQRPVGAQVTVSKAIAKTINVVGKIQLKQGYKLSDVQNECYRIIHTYLTGIAYEEDSKVLSYYKISDLLYNVAGVKDIIDYTVNGKKESITAQAEEFFELNSIEIKT